MERLKTLVFKRLDRCRCCFKHSPCAGAPDNALKAFDAGAPLADREIVAQHCLGARCSISTLWGACVIGLRRYAAFAKQHSSERSVDAAGIVRYSDIIRRAQTAKYSFYKKPPHWEISKILLYAQENLHFAETNGPLWV